MTCEKTYPLLFNDFFSAVGVIAPDYSDDGLYHPGIIDEGQF